MDLRLFPFCSKNVLINRQSSKCQSGPIVSLSLCQSGSDFRLEQKRPNTRHLWLRKRRDENLSRVARRPDAHFACTGPRNPASHPVRPLGPRDHPAPSTCPSFRPTQNCRQLRTPAPSRATTAGGAHVCRRRLIWRLHVAGSMWCAVAVSCGRLITLVFFFLKKKKALAPLITI